MPWLVVVLVGALALLADPWLLAPITAGVLVGGETIRSTKRARRERVRTEEAR